MSKPLEYFMLATTAVTATAATGTAATIGSAVLMIGIVALVALVIIGFCMFAYENPFLASLMLFFMSSGE
jgi:hypothetical protein